MTDKHITVDSIRWHSVLPCLHLLRAAQLALRVRVLLLALLTVILFSAGRVAINSLPFVNPDGFGRKLSGSRCGAGVRRSARSGEIPAAPFDRSGGKHGDLERLALATCSRVAGLAAGNGPCPGSRAISPQQSWVSLASAWTRLLWALLIWGTLGGAIIRMVAVRFARDESVPVGRAVASSARLWQSHLYGPLLPLLGIGILSLGIHTVGWLERGVGNSNGWVLLLLGWIPLILGFLMAALLILTAISWPLMVAAISTEEATASTD